VPLEIPTPRWSMRAGAGFDFYQAGIGRRLKIEAGGRPFATLPALLIPIFAEEAKEMA
jgi:hypothetical protein